MRELVYELVPTGNAQKAAAIMDALGNARRIQEGRWLRTVAVVDVNGKVNEALALESAARHLREVELDWRDHLSVTLA